MRLVPNPYVVLARALWACCWPFLMGVALLSATVEREWSLVGDVADRWRDVWHEIAPADN